MKHVKGYFTVTLLNETGEVQKQWVDLPNITHNEGEEFLIGALIRKATYSTDFLYMGLDDRAALAEGDKKSTVSQTNEVTGSNYSRMTFSCNASGFPTFSINGSNDWFANAATAAFSAKGTWTSAKNFFICTDTCLFGSVALDAQVILTAGNCIKVNYTLKVKEPA